MSKHIHLSFDYHLQVAYFLTMPCSESKYYKCVQSADNEIFLREKIKILCLWLMASIKFHHNIADNYRKSM